MKTLAVISLFLLSVQHQLFAQQITADSMKPLILSERVGEKIDRAERDHYRILQSIQNFVSATFYQVHETLYVALVEIQQADGMIQTLKMEYPLSVLFRIAEKINNFEEISAGRYFSGEDVTVITVVGGESLRWAPILPTAQISTIPNQSSSNSEQVDKDEHPTAEREEEFQQFEFKLSYGRGYAKGAPAFHSEDAVIQYDSPSYIEVSNAKDDYVSLGQGQRYEMKLIYYCTQQVGFFLEAVNSSDEKELRRTTTYRFTTSSPTTDIIQVKLRFNIQQIVTGVHFRLPFTYVVSYGGIGAGLWLPSDVVMNYKYNFGGTNIERDEKMELNAPLGFTGYVGFSIPLSAKFSIFVEGKSSLAMYYLKRLETTKYVVNGEDHLSTLSTRDKITVFEENKNYRKSPANDPNSPSFGGPPYPVAAGNVSITAGLSVHLFTPF